MTGFAIQALLLMRLEEKASRWVETAELATYVGSREDHVANVLDGLSQRGLVRVQRETATSPVLRAMVEPSTKGAL